MPDARPHVRCAAARASAAAGHGQGVPGRLARQARDRAGGLPRRAAADDRERHLHRQRHRARDRLPAAPQPGRDLRPRQGQDPQLRQAAVPGARDSVPRLLARLRVRRQGLRVRAHRPPPQAAGHHPAARARLLECRHPAPVLRPQHRSPDQEGTRARARARAPARRDRDVRDQRQRQGHRRGGPPHHRAPRAPARGSGRQAPARPRRVPRGQGPGPRRRRSLHRGGARQRERRADDGAGRALRERQRAGDPHAVRQ